MQKPMSQSNGGLAASRRRAGAAQGLSRRRRRRRHQLQPAQRLHHGAARRQRRRQDHHHLHADGARGADLGRGARVRRRHGPRAPQGAASHELREPLRRRADAAHGAAEPRDVRQALRRARPQGAHRRDRPASSGSPSCSTGPTASCRPARRRASASPRRCSTSPSCCCSTSRPPRSIPTPPTGCAPSSRLYCRGRAATVVLASHNMAEVERLADRVIMLEKGRIIADETPAELIKRFGRANLEEVFLAIARRGAEDGEDARGHDAERRPPPRSSPLREQTTLAASARRIWAMVLRYWYVIRSSWPRTAELIYWPLVQMLMWGFLQSYLAQTTSFAAKAAGPVHRRRAAVGHPGAQPARLRGGVPGGDLVAQPRPPDDEPAAARRADRRADRRQPHQAAGGDGAGGAARLPLLRLQRAEPGLRVRRLLRQPRHHELVAGARLDRRGAALGPGRGELRLADRVRVPAAVLRLLSRHDAARAGCSRLRWRCRPPTYSRACAPSCSRAPSSAT